MSEVHSGSPGGACSGCGGCPRCRGVRAVTPRELFQRPGLPAIGARIGVYADFLASMQARLSSRDELDDLTVRTLDDPSMALLDCWAVVGDTVTFYQERALNEGYLATAAQPESVTYLGRLVGYRPRPALASSGHLAFTMDPGQDGDIPAGSSAKSIAGPEEQPQTFETSDDLRARADWNQLEVRTTLPVDISVAPDTLEQLTFVGSALNLKAGDLLVLDFGQDVDPVVRDIATVTPDHPANRTVVALVPLPGVAVGVLRALTVVRDLAETAAKNAKTDFQQRIGRLLEDEAERFDNGRGEVLPALATILRLVRESSALADADRLSSSDASWVRDQVVRIERHVLQAIPLATELTRQRAPELAYLERLAEAITCPGGEAARVAKADCSSGFPLLATATALGAMRRPPSRPPGSAASVPQPLTSSLSPRADGLRELLAGGDPRLTAALAKATATLPVTGPRPAAAVVALRTTSSLVPDRTASDTRVVSLPGSPDNLVAGGWIVSRQLVPDEGQGVVAVVPGPPKIEKVTRATKIEDVLRLVRTVSSGDSSVRLPVSMAITSGEILSGNQDRLLNLVTVWFGDQPLTLAEEPLLDPVGGGEIDLARPYPGLAPGRLLVVSGERSDIPGVTGVMGTEVVMVGAVEQRVHLDLPGDLTLPVLVLVEPLAYEYIRSTVTIRGNVVGATQGETRSEILGSGQARLPGQAFTLRQPTLLAPLTHLPSVSVTGESSTLVVRVDGVRWHPTELLADAGPRDHAYAVEEGPAPTVAVRFGDGSQGARLPNGVENVTARYRVGAGPSGNVGPERIRQLTSRPLGVSGVDNPAPMTGGTRADSADDARTVAPLRTLALDRLVSVADHADFALAYAGIAKASATRLREGSREVVHLTVAAIDDAPLVPGDDLMGSLEQTLAAYGDPHLPVRVDVRRLLRLVLSAGLKVDADHLFDDVAARVRAGLLDSMGFRRAALGRPVYLSRVIASIQRTPGVDYVDVDTFGALSDVADPVRLLTEVTGLGAVAGVVPVHLARSVRRDYFVGKGPVGEEDDTLSAIALRYGLSLAELVSLNPALRDVALPDGSRVVVEDGICAAEVAYFDPKQPQTIVLRRIK